MRDEEKLDLLLERFYQRYNRYNTKVIRLMGETIKKFDGITPSVAHKLQQQLKYGKDINELLLELSEITNKSVEDITESMEVIAKDNLEFSEVIAKAKNREFIKYEENEQLQKLVKSISKETSKNLINISNSRAIGFTLIEDNKRVFKPLKKVYNDLIDEAVYNVTTGNINYQQAMRNTLKQLANSGVRINKNKVEYKSGYTRRLDSSIRQNILDGVRTLNIDIQKQVGEEYGADGVEVSHHIACAEDHLIIDGQQFSNKEFQKINNNLVRQVGTLNCRHFVFSIVLGVNKPEYTKKQLKRDRKRNEKGFNYEGKHYTLYKGTQLQRKIETEVRKNKDAQIIARASGNKDLIAESQRNISILTDKYNELSKVSGLPMYKERMLVSGYRRVSTK